MRVERTDVARADGKFFGKNTIDYNGKRRPITTQGFAQASENLPASERKKRSRYPWLTDRRHDNPGRLEKSFAD
jgi:hypothetical protein